MQITIKNMHIFDKRIGEEFKKYIEKNREKFESGKCYSLIIRYNADSVLKHDDFDFENSIYNEVEVKFKHQNRENEALSTQLKTCHESLKKNEIECYTCKIEGDNTKNNNIKILIKEDKSEYKPKVRGRNKKRITGIWIVPDKAYFINNLNKHYNERVNEIYSKFSDGINNKIMCRILGIEYTDNENEIFKSFVKQYGDLWLCTVERAEELKQKMFNRLKKMEREEKKKLKANNNEK